MITATTTITTTTVTMRYRRRRRSLHVFADTLPSRPGHVAAVHLGGRRAGGPTMRRAFTSAAAV